jgi:hypothetical protein
MDEFGSTISGEDVAVPEQLRSEFNNPDEVRVQPGSWHWHGAVPSMPATHVTFEQAGDVDRRDWDDSYPPDLGT